MEFYYDPTLDTLQRIVEQRDAKSRKALISTLAFFAVTFSVLAVLV